jgi:uncharacterized protein YndB with AHSA1/START domain
VKKAPPKKAPVKKSAAGKTPVKKAPVKMAPVKMAAVKMAPVQQATTQGLILQTVTFDAPPDAIYRALLDAEQHAAFTGALANVDARVGGRFDAWDGYIEGEILELEAERRIVQSWRAADFPESHPESRLEIRLSRTDDGTTLELVHSGLPDSMVAGFDSGWHEHYWEPLRRWLSSRSGS